jgi:hypothetical protein
MLKAARNLVRRNVNVIFAATPDALATVKRATTSIPIVAVDLERDPLVRFPPAGLSCGNWAASGALFLFGRAKMVARRKVAWSR